MRHGGASQRFKFLTASLLKREADAVTELIAARLSGNNGSVSPITAACLEGLADAIAQENDADGANSLPEFPEFAAAHRNIALTPKFFRASKLKLFTRALDPNHNKLVKFNDDSKKRPAGEGGATGFFDYDRCATLLLCKAFKIDLAAVPTFTDPFSNQRAFNMLKMFTEFAWISESRRRAVATSYNVLLDLAPADELQALVGSACDRGFRCESAKQWGAAAIVVAAGDVLTRHLHSERSLNQIQKPLADPTSTAPVAVAGGGWRCCRFFSAIRQQQQQQQPR